MFNLYFLIPIAVGLNAAAGMRIGSKAAARIAVIQNPSMSSLEFTPVAGQSVSLAFRLTKPGRCLLVISDRDGVEMARVEAASASLKPGSRSLSWDGKDRQGSYVADEAYTLALACSGKGWSETWDPASGFVPEVQLIRRVKYNSQDGILTYHLDHLSRVHFQASLKANMPDGTANFVVYRTIVNREPRLDGTQTEAWTGFDETGTVYLPSFPNYGVGGVATSLPENTVIVHGTPSRSALNDAVLRGIPVRKFGSDDHDHMHHRRLMTVEDWSPGSTVTLKGLRPEGEPLPETIEVDVKLDGPTIPWFLSQPTTLEIYLDESLLVKLEQPEHPYSLQNVKVGDLKPGRHRIVANWYSRFGPLADGIATFELPEKKPAAVKH